MNVKYAVQCSNHGCRAKRTYESKTFGDCLKLAKSDGWKLTGEMTKMVCKKCSKLS